MELVLALSEYTKINNHAIELIDKQQPPYEPIYSLKPIELEILKIYIKTNLANGFMRHFKSLVGASIFFYEKPNGSFRLCVDY